MNKTINLLKLLSPKGWGLFEGQTELLNFLTITAYVLYASIFIGFWGGFKAFLFISILGFSLNIVFFILINKFSNIAGGLFFHSSREKDHKAIIKGMYSKANGLKLTGRYEKSVEAYQKILTNYPEELDAYFFMGQTYYPHINNPTKALKEFNTLDRKLKNKKINYKFKEALKQNIKGLKQVMES